MTNQAQFQCKNPVTHAEAVRIITRQLEDRRAIDRGETDRRGEQEKTRDQLRSFGMVVR